MKKFLLILGFLPFLAFADVGEVSPKEALTKQMAEIMNYVHSEDFTDEHYQNELTLYQNRYNQSDKNEMCRQTVETLTQQLNFQRQLNFDKIKNDLVAPVVATLSDEQAQTILTAMQHYRDNDKTPKVLDDFGKLLFSHVNKVMSGGKQALTLADLYTNCPVKD